MEKTISKRDLFAAAALPHCLSKYIYYTAAIQEAFRIADRMLQAQQELVNQQEPEDQEAG